MRGLLNCDLAMFESFNKYSFPDILPYKEKVDCSDIIKWIDFENGMKERRKSQGLHFYIHDFKYERVWNNPNKYISAFESFEYIIQPDYSLYFNFPVALQIYNKYRNHWLNSYYSMNGVEMIPNISLSTSDNYKWSFLGYPKKSVIAFSDIGAKRDKNSFEVIKDMYDEMIKRLEPIQVLYFTRSKKNIPTECDVILLPFIKGGEISG